MKIPVSVAAIFALALPACSSSVKPFATSVGVLQPKSTIVVRAMHAEINAYKPEVGKAANQFVIEASGPRSGVGVIPSQLRGNGKTLVVSSGNDVTGLLVRVPQGVALDASSSAGDINVTDITGTVTAHADNGNVKVMVPGAVQAGTGPGKGNVTVYMGTSSWPGTLRFGAQQGDVEVWINADARFHAHMHTDNGTIFTDFSLRGTSQGTSETIDGQNGGTSMHGVDIEVHNGSIRLLQLKPQM